MRIEAYNQVAQVYNNHRVQKAKTSQAQSMGRDQVQIVSHATDLNVAKQAVREAPDVREDKVAEMKAKLNSGNYSVDTGDFASMLLEKFNGAL
ncbi:MAG: flagellar biosynthesis anti-sigma factor FlgM [Lachnospiraceae bacterium]|jgi:negative regulator of flagellin synthesis FlgM|nr:flagellar biosynthesis anti-sigma factor FlgM [Lachnospiraceae bacterium]MCI7329012.1 flagellar biosynthesis anti-sigma factor FlgM [Lachnospiraceae bacterium]